MRPALVQTGTGNQTIASEGQYLQQMMRTQVPGRRIAMGAAQHGTLDLGATGQMSLKSGAAARMPQ